MRSGPAQLTLSNFLCPNYKPGCWAGWQNLPTIFRMGLRNSAGQQLGTVAQWSQSEFGVTRTINIPTSGNYAVNTSFSPFNGTGTVPPGDPCYEMYFNPFFSVQLTFTPYTG